MWLREETLSAKDGKVSYLIPSLNSRERKREVIKKIKEKYW